MHALVISTCSKKAAVWACLSRQHAGELHLPTGHHRSLVIASKYQRHLAISRAHQDAEHTMAGDGSQSVQLGRALQVIGMPDGWT